MQVVQTPSPWAMVARRWTWRPRTWPMASVSASHSCGNSWATWETGQCCWHSCSAGGQSVEQGQRPHGCGVPLAGEDPGQRLGRRELRVGGGDRGVVALDERHAAAGELQHGLVAAGLREVAQRLDGEVVVLLVEVVAARLGDREHLGRTAPTTSRGRPRVTRLEGALGEEVVEVPAYGGRRQVEPLGEVGGRRRSVDQDRPDDALARRLVAGGRLDDGPLEFHNTSVPLMS